MWPRYKCSHFTRNKRNWLGSVVRVLFHFFQQRTSFTVSFFTHMYTDTSHQYDVSQFQEGKTAFILLRANQRQLQLFKRLFLLNKLQSFPFTCCKVKGHYIWWERGTRISCFVYPTTQKKCCQSQKLNFGILTKSWTLCGPGCSYGVSVTQMIHWYLS